MGKLLASKYASQGATVVGWDINEELNSQTIEHINKSGNPKAYGYRYRKFVFFFSFAF